MTSFRFDSSSSSFVMTHDWIKILCISTITYLFSQHYFIENLLIIDCYSVIYSIYSQFILSVIYSHRKFCLMNCIETLPWLGLLSRHLDYELYAVLYSCCFIRCYWFISFILMNDTSQFSLNSLTNISILFYLFRICLPLIIFIED